MYGATKKKEKKLQNVILAVFGQQDSSYKSKSYSIYGVQVYG